MLISGICFSLTMPKSIGMRLKKRGTFATPLIGNTQTRTKLLKILQMARPESGAFLAPGIDINARSERK
jgi:hypothetical protein